MNSEDTNSLSKKQPLSFYHYLVNNTSKICLCRGFLLENVASVWNNTNCIG